MAGCQQEEWDSLGVKDVPQGPPVYKDPQNPENPGFKPPTIIKKNFPNATAWKIIWEDIPFDNCGYGPCEYLPIYFSTLNGSLHSADFLNAIPLKNTANVDMSLFWDMVRSPSHVDNFQLIHWNHAKSTQFKRSGMSAADFADYAQNNPAMFQDLFENEPYGVSDWQPNRFDPGYEHIAYYESGDIYTFKTDRVPSKYGAIRIVEGWIINPERLVIEVVVQKNGFEGFFPEALN